MARTKGKVGYTPDGQGFEEIIIPAANVDGTDGGTVQEHLDDAASHVPETSVQNAGKVLGTSALGKPSWLSLGTAAERNTGTANGNVPVVGANGKLDPAIMPKVAITDTFVVSTQAAMLALEVEVGDVCVRTDLSKTYILQKEPATTLANWQEMLTPVVGVTTVNGKTGDVTLAKADVGLGSVDNTADANKNVASAAKLATPRAFSLAGEVQSTAAVNFDGSGPGAINTKITTRDCVCVNSESEIAASGVRAGGLVIVKL